MLPVNVTALSSSIRKRYEAIAKADGGHPTLKGFCFRASNKLKLRLIALGHAARIQPGYMCDAWGFATNVYHVCVVFNETHIIDLTATQFGYTDKVLVSSINSKRYKTI